MIISTPRSTIRGDTRGFLKFTNERLGREDLKDLRKEYDDLTGEGLEQGMISLSYEAPTSLARIVRKYVIDDAASFLDVGAGSGLQAVELRKVGFTGDFDALEPSEGLTKEAKKHRRYRRYFTEFLTDIEPYPIASDTYDNIVATASFVPQHIKYQAIPELLRIVKTGGHLFICTRLNCLLTDHYQGFSEFVEKLQKDGLCEFTKLDIPVYYLDYPGLVFVFKKL